MHFGFVNKKFVEICFLSLLWVLRNMRDFYPLAHKA